MSSERIDGDGGPVDTRLRDVVLNRARVSLRFVIGRKEIATSTAMSLATGQIIPLDRPISNRVALDLEGTTIGEGELVSVDGLRGVRLLSLDEPTR